MGDADGSLSIDPSAVTAGSAARPGTARPPSFRQVLKIHAYRHLFAANVLSQLGDQLTKVAMASLVLVRTGSTVLAALSFAITYLPWVLGGPLLSSYADRLPRRHVMIVCNTARAGLVLTLAAPHVPVAVLLALLFCSNLLGAPAIAAQAALMPELLDGEAYTVANGLDAIVRQTAQIGGYAVGGVIVWALSPAGALIADAATFAAGAALILGGVPRADAAALHDAGPRPSLVRDTAQAARAVFADPHLRAYVLLFWVAASFTYTYEAIAVPYATDLGGGARSAGLLLAAGPVGETLGIIIVSRLVPQHRRVRLLLPMAALGTAALIPVLAIRSLPAILPFVMLAGVGVAFNVPLNSLFGRAVPSEYRGRAFGLVAAGLSAAYGLTMLTAGALADTLSPRTVIGANAVLGTLAVLALGPMWHRAVLGGTRSSVSSGSRRRPATAPRHAAEP